MTYNRLSGVYFEETVETITNEGENGLKLFIIQGGDNIDTLDDKLVRMNNFNTFEVLIHDSNLPNTVSFMDKYFGDVSEPFFVYKVKTNNKQNFENLIKENVPFNNITGVIYFEETASGTEVPLSDKITAIKTALKSLSKKGYFLKGYIIPYGTIKAADTNKGENERSETVVKSTIVNSSNTIASGRICVIFPEDYAGVATEQLANVEYNKEAGKEPLNVTASQIKYHFTEDEMIELQNAGVNFVKLEDTKNGSAYRINLGVTTSFAQDKADGLLISRNIADELLYQVKLECLDFLKDKKDENSIIQLNENIRTIIDRFADNGDVDADETYLEATDGNDVFTAKISGRIKPYGSLIAIDIYETLV